MVTRACDVMQDSVVTVSPEDTLHNVRCLFADEQIHGAPVVDDQGRVMGVISTSDLLRASVEDAAVPRAQVGYYEDGLASYDLSDDHVFEETLSGTRVADVMTLDKVSVPPDAPIAEVARTLSQNGVHRVLVIDDGQLLGIISSYDLIALLEKEE